MSVIERNGEGVGARDRDSRLEYMRDTYEGVV